MNIGEVKLGVPFLTFLQWKSALFCIFQMLPSVSKIITVTYFEKSILAPKITHLPCFEHNENSPLKVGFIFYVLIETYLCTDSEKSNEPFLGKHYY